MGDISVTLEQSAIYLQCLWQQRQRYNCTYYVHGNKDKYTFVITMSMEQRQRYICTYYGLKLGLALGIGLRLGFKFRAT